MTLLERIEAAEAKKRREVLISLGIISFLFLGIVLAGLFSLLRGY